MYDHVKAAPSFNLAPYIDAHSAVFPGSTLPAARYGKVFKRLERTHGADETLRRWKICLERKHTFATPEELAAHWSEYGAIDTKPSSARIEHWADKRAREEAEAAEYKKITLEVGTRRAKADGDLWWDRMRRECRSSDMRDVFRYAHKHIPEGADAVEAA